MASSNVIAFASRSPPDSDLPRQSSNSQSDQTRGFSMNMDEILRNIYSDPTSYVMETNGRVGEGGLVSADGGIRHVSDAKTADEVWRDIVSGTGVSVAGSPAMTLEDFLAKAGVVPEEDARVPSQVSMPPPPPPPSTVVSMPPPPPPPPTVGSFGIETVMMNPVAGVSSGQFSNVEYASGMTAVGGGGRGKRRAAVDEAPLDKATQQKQRRMIKNRESAARSRERKQAYTVELEALVTQLEEDNARLLREEVELTKERYKQLMQNLVPVEEMQRPERLLPMQKPTLVKKSVFPTDKLIPEKEQRQRVLRRTRSAQW